MSQETASPTYIYIYIKYIICIHIIKGPKYREVRPINLEKAKRCMLEKLENFISSWCYKNGVDKSFFL